MAAAAVLSQSGAAQADDGYDAPPAAPSETAPLASPSQPAAPAIEPPPASSSPAAGTEPPSVQVVGARLRSTPGSVYVVNQRTLERYHYDDPNSVMKLVPGVYVRQEDGVGLRPNIGIRGGLSDRSKKVTLMEDGVLFGPAPYSAPAAYYFPLMARFTQVRVLKGPAAIAYGPQTIGGAVDFITRPIPSMTRGSVDLALGDYGYAMFHGWAGTSTETTGMLIEGIHMQSTGFKELPSGADTGFARNEWMVKGSHDLAPHSELTHEIGIKLTYSSELSNETYLGLTDADFRQNPNARYGVSGLDRMRWFHSGIAVTHVIQPTRNLKITTTAYRNDFFRTWRKVNEFRGAALFDVLDDPTTAKNAVYHAILAGRADSSNPNETLMIGPNQRDFTSQGVQTRADLELETGRVMHRIQYGLRFHNDSITRRHSQDGFLVIGGQLIPEGTPTQVTAYNEGLTYAFSAHAYDAMTWKRLTVTPGVRVELIKNTFYDRLTGDHTGAATQVVLPGVGAFLALTDELGLLGGVHRGMSPPIPDSGPSGRPELSVNYEGGVRYWKGAFRTEVIGYANDYSNLTSICTFSEGCVTGNLDQQFDAGRALIYGAELFAEHELPLTKDLRIPLRGSYTYTHAEFRESFKSQDPVFGNVTAGDEMPYVPRHQAFVSAGLEADVAGGYVSADYVSKMREQTSSAPLGDALTTDAQFLVDTGGYYRPLKWLKVYASVRNVFDEQYIVSRRPLGARPNAPRWVQVGAKVDF